MTYQICLDGRLGHSTSFLLVCGRRCRKANIENAHRVILNGEQNPVHIGLDPF